MKNFFLFFLTVCLTPVFLSGQIPGSLDPSFNGNGVINMQINGLRTAFYRTRVQPDGKILAVGTMRGGLGYATAVLARFNTDGTLDADFANSGIYMNQEQDAPFDSFGADFQLLPDGKILLVADVVWEDQFATIRLLPNGQHDPTYGTNGVSFVAVDAFLPRVLGTMFQPDGKLVIVGYYHDLNVGTDQSLVVRVLADGAIDSTFAGVGYKLITTPNSLKSLICGGVAIQPDGKLVIPGSFGNVAEESEWYIYRLLPNGDFDASFGSNGLIIKDLGATYWEGANTAIVLSDGKIVVGGYAQKYPGYHFTMLRFLPDGTLDNTFGFGGKAQLGFNCCYSSIYNIIQQPDGKLLACGYSADNDTHEIFSIARFKPNGLVDQAFGDAGKVALEFAHDSTQWAFNMALQPDGKILAAGYIGESGYGGGGIMVRLNPGALVNTFSPNSDSNLEVEVSPNPIASSTLQVAYTLEAPTNVSIRIVDLLGREILRPIQHAWRSEGDQKEELDLPQDLPQGQYLLRIETETGSQMVKFLKTAP